MAASLCILGASLAISRVIVKRQGHGAVPAPPAAPATAASVVRPARPALPQRPSPVASVTPAAPGTPKQAAGRAELPVLAEDPLSEALCRKGMLLVEGTTCADPKRRCEEQDPAHPGTCRRFAPSRCRPGLSLRFCVDRNEYPNVPAMAPAVMITYLQAEDACQAEGKRLCSESEWAFACEGPAALSFSYGDEAQPGTCNVGRELGRVAPEELWEARNVAAIVERFDERVPSASQAGCVSPFGVHDLVGNVEEWVRSDFPGFDGALRGGGYAGSPSCRTVRQMRTAGFRQIQTGFRCCADPLPRAPTRKSERPSRPGLVAPRARFD